jgi:hypothetical protein
VTYAWRSLIPADLRNSCQRIGVALPPAVVCPAGQCSRGQCRTTGINRCSNSVDGRIIQQLAEVQLCLIDRRFLSVIGRPSWDLDLSCITSLSILALRRTLNAAESGTELDWSTELGAADIVGHALNSREHPTPVALPCEAEGASIPCISRWQPSGLHVDPQG